MLFNEIYGNYFNAVAQILTEAVRGELTEKRIYEIIDSKAFAESSLSIPDALKSGEWPLLEEGLETPLLSEPQMPLTTLQKRWLKALLADPRIRLFDLPDGECADSDGLAGDSVGVLGNGLEDVKPLYRPGDIVYFDQYSDGDPYEDETYIANFRTALRALRERRGLRVSFTGGRGISHIWHCVPLRMEYSLKDDKFRLIVRRVGSNHDSGSRGDGAWTAREERVINIARITECELLDPFANCIGSGAADDSAASEDHAGKERLVLELTDERNALERAMLHFSHLEKETTKLAPDETSEESADKYRLTLWYKKDDETEILIRVLSFGPMIRVLEPDNFIDLIRERLEMQKRF